METTVQPLLHSSSKTSHHKSLYLLLCFASIFFTFYVINNNLLFNPPFQNICVHAHDLQSCLAIVSEISSNTTTTTKLNHVHLLQLLLKKSTSQIQNIIQQANHYSHRINDPGNQGALVDCVNLMELSIDRLADSILALQSVTPNSHADAHTWLSSVLSNHVTCLDGLNLQGPVRFSIEPVLKDLIARARASLAILVEVSPEKDGLLWPLKGEFPSWVTSRDRKLLQALPGDVKANVVVAKDGSGNYKTVKEAVASAPNDGKTRYVIYVKKGTYKENVEVGKSKKNVMLVGDGMDSTIITGSLNVVDGSTTFNSATLGNHLLNLFAAS